MRKLLSIVLVLSFGLTFGQDDCFPEKPKSQDILVHEYYDFLNDQEERMLNDKLVKFARETSNQIVVVVVDDLCGYDPARFAFDIGEKWGVGQSKFDNGVVVLVKPTGGQGQRKTFIAVGYGLEGVIPDLTAKQIVDQELIGNFKNGQFYKGLDEGTDVLMSLAIGEFNSEEYGQADAPSPAVLLVPLLFIIFMVWIFFRSVRKYANTNNVSFWVAMMLMNQASRRHNGSWGGFSSGSGGFGGGGGFGGFGGGGFGGGGAGGSW